MTRSGKIASALLLVCAVVAGRLLPHPWNFTPLAGAALAGGTYLGIRHGTVVVVMSLLVSDYFLGGYDWKLMAVVYGMSLATVQASRWIKGGRRPLKTLLVALGSSLGFFLTTNLAVWAFSPWYAHDFAGLIRCYWLALPFFRNSLAGDAFYVGLFCLTFETFRGGLWTTALKRCQPSRKSAVHPSVYT